MPEPQETTVVVKYVVEITQVIAETRTETVMEVVERTPTEHVDKYGNIEHATKSAPVARRTQRSINVPIYRQEFAEIDMAETLAALMEHNTPVDSRVAVVR